MRLAIFKRELPLVLEALRFGDRRLFEAHPELDQAPILVHFQAGRHPGSVRSYGHRRWTGWDRFWPVRSRCGATPSSKPPGTIPGRSRWLPADRAGYRQPLRVNNWDRALWELTKASERPNLVDRMGDITCPSLVVSGDDDRIVPVESSVRLAEELPNAELVVIPNCGHVPQEECPGPFLDAVEAFARGES